MSSIIFGWPAVASTYDISYFDVLRGITSVVATGYKKISYEFAAPDTRPGALLVYPNRNTGRAKPFVFPFNDAPILASLRWEVRAAIDDTEASDVADIQYPETPKWSNTEIDSAIHEAIQLFNNYLQNEVTIKIPVKHLTSDTVKNSIDIIKISYYDEQSREWRMIPQFSRRGRHQDRRYGQFIRHWDIIDGEMKLYGFLPTDQDVELEIKMRVPYKIPYDDLSIIDIPRDDWDILSIYAQGKCYMRLAGQSAQLDRWIEGHKRNDNPVLPVARALLRDAVSRLEDRKGPRPIRKYRG